MSWSGLFRVSLFSLMFVLAAPFSMPAGYLLDITETDDDLEPGIRVVTLIHEDGREVYLKITRFAVSVFSMFPKPGTQHQPIVRFMLDMDGSHVPMGVWVEYDGISDYLDLDNSTTAEMDAVLVDAVDELRAFQDVEFWKELSVFLRQHVNNDDCEEKTINVAQGLLGMVQTNRTLVRLAQFNTMVQNIPDSGKACYPFLYPSNPAEENK